MKQQNVANYAKIRYFEWIKWWIETELKFFVFENYLNVYNVFIAAKDVKIYCSGVNNFNLLAFGHNILLKNYVINKLLTLLMVSISYWKVNSNTLDSIGIPIPFQGIGMELGLKFKNPVELELKSVELEWNWDWSQWS